MISDALSMSLLYDAVIDVELMKIAAMKAIMYMVDSLLIHTTAYDTFSGRVARCGRRKLEMDDVRINMDYIAKVAKCRGIYSIRENKMDYIVNSDKMI